MKKIISILLILTIFSSLFLLTACDDSNANNTNIIPGKANYVEYSHNPDADMPYYFDGLLVNAEKITDNYFFIHVMSDSNSSSIVLVNKNQVRWYYQPNVKMIKDEQKYSLDEMKNMICEEEDVIIYAEDGFLAIEDKTGRVKYYDHQYVFYGCDG